MRQSVGAWPGRGRSVARGRRCPGRAGWVKGADVTMLVGLAISSLLYLVLCRSLDIDAERAVVTSADAGLDETFLTAKIDL
ncbi:hypothetical protein GWI24_00060 [Streptomyces sp. MK37H]|nr:hypothetical protein [Streptomyces sp. MK37H]